MPPAFIVDPASLDLSKVAYDRAALEEKVPQRFEMAFLPPPIVRSDLEVLLHLGKSFGLWDTQWTAREVFEEMKNSVTSYANAEWDSEAVVGHEASVAPADAYDVLLSPPPAEDSTNPIKPVAGAAS